MKSVKTQFKLSLVSALSLVVFSCQKSNQFHTPDNQPATYSIIEDELIPTSVSSENTKTGLKYQVPQKKIKNEQAELLLGHVKMEKTKISYDPATRKMSVSGLAQIVDSTQKAIDSSDFYLLGSHEVDNGVFGLSSEKNIIANSNDKPVVRAKVTCLNLNSKDQFDCSRAVVDFFIAYKKQIYTEQMELVPKNQQPAQDSEPVKKQDDILIISNDVTLSDFQNQSEGEESSIEGRYQGQAETVDLVSVFKDDLAADKLPITKVPVLQDSPKTLDPKKSEPVKKDIQLTIDLQQTKSGDIRQINQAVGYPHNGRLRNATSVLDKQKTLSDKAHFELTSPKSEIHYSTYETAEMIQRMGQNLKQTSQNKLYVGHISKKIGGRVSPHLSHQIGLDADMAYPSTKPEIKYPVVVQMGSRKYNPSSYSIEQTYLLFKFVFKQQDIKVDRIFVDRTIKKALCEYAKSKNEFNSPDKEIVKNLFENIDHVDGHGDHFHLRLKCSSFDPACRQKLYTINNGCS